MDILCTNGVKSVMLELVPVFERARSTKIAVTWGSTNALLKDIKGGVSGGVAVPSPHAADELHSHGKAVAGNPAYLARTLLSCAAPQRPKRPNRVSRGGL